MMKSYTEKEPWTTSPPDGTRAILSSIRLKKCLSRFQHIYDLNVRRKRHVDFYAVNSYIKFIMHGIPARKAVKKIKVFIREQCRNPLSKKIVPTRKGKPHFREIEFKNKRKVL